VSQLEDGMKQVAAERIKFALPFGATEFTPSCARAISARWSRCVTSVIVALKCPLTDPAASTLEITMRATLALILAVTGSAAGTTALPGAAEAAGEYYRYRGKIYRRACGPDCVRANALDPGGNYKAYPDWARAALSPKTDGTRR
jgi:hypothetical protein